MTATTLSTATPAAPFMVHVEFKPRWSALPVFSAAMSRLLGQHEGVDVSVSGLVRDTRHLVLTVAVSLGPQDQIAKHSPASQAGYALIQEAFTALFDYHPALVAQPDEAARAAAAQIPVDLTGGQDLAQRAA